MSEFEQTFVNGEAIDTKLYAFARRAGKVGLVRAGVYVSNDNQVAVRFEELVTSFRDETARQLFEVASRSLGEDESASFKIYTKSGRIGYTLSSPCFERHQRTGTLPFDEAKPQASLNNLFL